MDTALTIDGWPGLVLWMCPLHGAPQRSRAACLDADETARARRFVHDVHRRRYLASHVALRERLGDALGVAAGALRLSADALGKPRLADGRGWQFNMSHSGDWMLLGLHPTAALGVDIEELRRVEDALALARRHYTEAERVAVEQADARSRDEVFLRIWTRKEACLKALGLGLRLAPSSFEAGSQPGASVARLAAPQGIAAVEVLSVETGHGAVGAVARVL